MHSKVFVAASFISVSLAAPYGAPNYGIPDLNMYAPQPSAPCTSTEALPVIVPTSTPCTSTEALPVIVPTPTPCTSTEAMPVIVPTPTPCTSTEAMPVIAPSSTPCTSTDAMPVVVPTPIPESMEDCEEIGEAITPIPSAMPTPAADQISAGATMTAGTYPTTDPSNPSNPNIAPASGSGRATVGTLAFALIGALALF